MNVQYILPNLLARPDIKVSTYIVSLPKICLPNAICLANKWRSTENLGMVSSVVGVTALWYIQWNIFCRKYP
jgi:hypothetical protein